jgi:hypothetical protein
MKVSQVKEKDNSEERIEDRKVPKFRLCNQMIK